MGGFAFFLGVTGAFLAMSSVSMAQQMPLPAPGGRGSCPITTGRDGLPLTIAAVGIVKDVQCPPISANDANKALALATNAATAMLRNNPRRYCSSPCPTPSLVAGSGRHRKDAEGMGGTFPKCIKQNDTAGTLIVETQAIFNYTCR